MGTSLTATAYLGRLQLDRRRRSRSAGGEARRAVNRSWASQPARCCIGRRRWCSPSPSSSVCVYIYIDAWVTSRSLSPLLSPALFPGNVLTTRADNAGPIGVDGCHANLARPSLLSYIHETRCTQMMDLALFYIIYGRHQMPSVPCSWDRWSATTSTGLQGVQ